MEESSSAGCDRAEGVQPMEESSSASGNSAEGAQPMEESSSSGCDRAEGVQPMEESSSAGCDRAEGVQPMEESSSASGNSAEGAQPMEGSSSAACDSSEGVQPMELGGESRPSGNSDIEVDDACGIVLLEDFSVSKQAKWQPFAQARKATVAAAKVERETNSAHRNARKEEQDNKSRLAQARNMHIAASAKPKIDVPFTDAVAARCCCGLCLAQRGERFEVGSKVRMAHCSGIASTRQSLSGKEGTITDVRERGQMPYEAALGGTKARWFKAHELVACDPSSIAAGLTFFSRRALVLANAGGSTRIGNVLNECSYLDAYGVQFRGCDDAQMLSSSNMAFLSSGGSPPVMEIGTRVRRSSVESASNEQDNMNSEAGIVVGSCLHGPLLVRFGAAGGAVVQVLSKDLASEADWQQSVMTQCVQNLPVLESKTETTRAAHADAVLDVKVKQKAQEPLQKQYAQSCSRLLAAAKLAENMELITLVKFRDESRPSVWRDLARFVTYDWAVQIGSSKPGSRPAVVAIQDVLALGRAVAKPQYKIPNGKKHVLLVRSDQLPSLQQRIEETDSQVAESFLESIEEDLVDVAILSLAGREANKIVARGKSKTKAPDPLHSFSLLKAALGAKRRVLLDDEVQEFLEGPETGLVRVKETPVPQTLHAELRSYQYIGFNWLVSNAANGFGSILADDMGLGKTLQALAFLLHRKETSQLTSPALVVVPTTLLWNWQDEIQKFAPDLEVHVYHGRGRKLLASATPERMSTPSKSGPVRRRLRFKQPDVTPAKVTVEPTTPVRAPKRAAPAQTPVGKFVERRSDVFLTSYATLREDEEKLKQQVFSCMILDESQTIKRYGSKTAQAAKRVADRIGAVRVALSGTPVENSLSDLHSQFEFILPGYLASTRAQFFRDFEQPITERAEKQADERKEADDDADDEETISALEQQRALQCMIKPFLMRREKCDPNIAPDLPDKLEKTYAVSLTEQQRALYKAVERKFLHSFSDEKFQRGQQVFTAAHAFRQICNHPMTLKQDHRPDSFESIVGTSSRGDAGASGKCELVMEILTTILERGEKVLIFTNYLEVVEMLNEQIEAKFSCKVLRIDGSMDTAARQAAVNRFQGEDECPVMVLTLKTGGVGLNLTRAGHVIHFDRGFNPAVECQATDRTHRIGQLQKVCVHTLIAKDTFEERIDRILRNKAMLSKMVVAANENWIADYSDDDLKELFRLGGSSDSLDGPSSKKAKTDGDVAQVTPAAPTEDVTSMQDSSGGSEPTDVTTAMDTSEA
eukprot:TRINITY_DN4894_c1_g2_i1.p1 TRINITY_DN4894_c1_g2~~TRINITY_DN4894_c1_g2_i1.p1  ORF type:complete len:1293 (-),score=260.14 TRINITY_DN4894_c1_g2_i1:151-3963(-)